VGQLLLVRNSTDAENYRLIEEAHVGGFVLYTKGKLLRTKQSVRRLTDDLQKAAKIPLIIAIDQEGGRVQRLGDGFPDMPSALEQARTNTCYYWGDKMGRELGRSGINVNLAPVVDINSNPENPVMGDRSYGKNADIVIESAHGMIKGTHNSHVLTCLKHFPGHGNVDTDSHVAMPVLNKTLDELEALELKPYRALHTLDTDCVMTSHILAVGLDPDEPVTFSKKAVDYLRNDIGFTGLILTDSLTMDGILSQADSLEEAAIKALKAGHDLLIIGRKRLNDEDEEAFTADDIINVHKALVQAIEDGDISEEQVEASYDRIMSLKRLRLNY